MTGWIGGGSSQPSFKFSKRVRIIRTAAGTATENIIITPNAAYDTVDVVIRNMASATTADVSAIPDLSVTGSGSLFPGSAFLTGALESRLLGYDVSIVPLGSRLSVAGAIQAALAHEDHLPTATAIDSLVANDIRSKRVPKVPGKRVCFTSVHHDLDEIVNSNSTAFAHGHVAGEALMAITIPSDGATAVQYSLDVIFHWEVAGTTVAQVATPNLHNAPLLEKIHHHASALHTQLQGSYLDPEASANEVSKKTTGFSWKSLLGMAGAAGNVIGGAEAMASGALGALESFGGALMSALPAIGEVAPLALMAL